MKTIGAFQAKTHLSKLLSEVETNGQRFIIKKRDKNIALLVPYKDKDTRTREEAQDLLDGIGNIRKTMSKKFEKNEIKEMIAAGRR